jgi:hypothetical protein
MLTASLIFASLLVFSFLVKRWASPPPLPRSVPLEIVSKTTSRKRKQTRKRRARVPIWSKGAFRYLVGPRWKDYCQVQTETRSPDHVFDDMATSTSGILWVRTSDIDTFSRVTVPQLKRDIVLVTGDDDCSVPGDLDPETVRVILASTHVKMWYTQNCDDTVTIPKLSPYPIGLDLHTARDGQYKTPAARYLGLVDRRQTPNALRRNRVFCDCHLALYPGRHGNPRAELLRQRPGMVDFLEKRVSQPQLYDMWDGYSFVVSLPGNGLDCHRTWEALLLGCIVVVKSSCLDPLYKGLAVLIVHSWSELTGERLDECRREMAHLTEPSTVQNAIRPGRWVNTPLRSQPSPSRPRC